MSNQPADISTEDIMAYVDGELSSGRAREVARAIAADVALQKDMDAYVSSRAELRHAFDDVLDEPVPEHLRQLVLEDNTVVTMTPRRTSRPFWQQAIAASVVLGVGLIIGANFSGDNPTPPSGMTAGSLVQPHPLADALTTASSGERRNIGDEDVHVVQTFIANGIDVCREYEVSSSSRGVTAIACRRNDAWQVEIVVGGVSRSASTQYLPAGGVNMAAIDEMHRALGGSDGVSKNLEQCLLANDWDPTRCAGS